MGNPRYWRYSANRCRLTIWPKPTGKFVLIINNEVCGVYESAQAAADDVLTCSTGYYGWDKQGIVAEPTDIHAWEDVREDGGTRQ